MVGMLISLRLFLIYFVQKMVLHTNEPGIPAGIPRYSRGIPGIPATFPVFPREYRGTNLCRYSRGNTVFKIPGIPRGYREYRVNTGNTAAVFGQIPRYFPVFYITNTALEAVFPRYSRYFEPILKKLCLFY